ncbi:MAG: helix-turn-helix transcriptional regulator [Marinoscillum sp.]|uniref:helix-turn-helix domain-containing protein n=2 Tax=Marinoscillum sp. TaxID=2024838 RepID=UPI0032F76EFD
MHIIKSISEYHQLANLPKPEHPLVSLVDYSQVNYQTDGDEISIVSGHYSIALKRGMNGKFRYGQQPYDFDEGLMSFVSPGQVITVKVHRDPHPHPTGWILLVHPDFLWGTPLATRIKNYEFFGYHIHEALFLSEKEEKSMIGIMENIREEYHANIDQFSQNIIISQIEVLLNYAERFYQRQFITRKISNHEILNKLEAILTRHFSRDNLASIGLPTVQEIADQLNVSPGYLSSLLKVLTGLNTQQHIHEKLIEKAKEKLSTTQLSVSEIAYGLGFEHSQSFSRLFKSKTNLSPLEFRLSFS